MAEPSPMILIAVDDQEHAWREMLVPFIVSLRRTTYQGRIGVIDYGLSQDKLKVLHEQDIVIVPPARLLPLACDRYISAANYVAEHDISHCALYDADIWFPEGDFDLFDQLLDPQRIYVAPDAWFCDFVTGSIKDGPSSQYLLDLGLHTVMQKFGTGLQAGMLAGAREAWSHFGHFISDCIARIPQDFHLLYGTDTAFLHIYAGLGNVLLVDKAYNHVPKWGVRESIDYNTGRVFFTSDGLRIQAMHMTGDSRYEPRWRYSNVCRDVMLDEGRRFLLPSDGERRFDAPLPVDPADFDWEPLGLRMIGAKGDGEVLAKPDLFHTLFTGGGIGRAFGVVGTASVSFEATRPTRFDLLNTYPFGTPTPEKLIFGVLGQDIVVNYPAARTWILDQGEVIRLETHSLYRSASRMAWGFRLR